MNALPGTPSAEVTWFDQVLCPDRALGHLNVELIVDFLDRLDVSGRADRQLEELRQTEEVFGVLGGISAPRVITLRQQRGEMPIEFVATASGAHSH